MVSNLKGMNDGVDLLPMEEEYDLSKLFFQPINFWPSFYWENHHKFKYEEVSYKRYRNCSFHWPW